jgi:VWFA-related protein
MIRKATVATLIFMLLLPPVAFGQVARSGATIDVSIVNVDVFVTDKAGNRVRGLTAADFEIRENGKVQPVSNFTEYSGSAAEGAVSVNAAAETATTPDKRTVIVFVERFSLPPDRTQAVFDGLRTMLHDTIRKGDAAAVVSWARQLEVRQQLTDDLEKLDKALTAIQTDARPLQHDDRGFAKRQLALEDEFQENMRRGAEDKFRKPGKGNMENAAEASAPIKGPDTQAKDVGLQDTYRSAKMEWHWIRQKAAAVESMIESIAGAEGRKIVIMATDRFGQYAGVDLFQGKVPSRYERDLDTKPIRDSLVATANAHNVTLYPVYPAAGHDWTAFTDTNQLTHNFDIQKVDRDKDASKATLTNDIMVNETMALGELAQRTGGQTAFSDKGMIELLPRIAEDLESYYSLGYRATAASGDATRKIAVKAKNPNYVVRTRQEIVEKSDLTRMKDRVLANLFQPLDAKKIPITATLGTVAPLQDGRRSASVSVKVPIGALLLNEGAGDPSGSFTVFVAAGGGVGTMTDVQQHTQPFSIPKDQLARAKASHFTYDVTVAVDKLAEKISVGVVDETSKEYGLATVTLPPGD